MAGESFLIQQQQWGKRDGGRGKPLNSYSNSCRENVPRKMLNLIERRRGQGIFWLELCGWPERQWEGQASLSVGRRKIIKRDIGIRERGRNSISSTFHPLRIKREAATVDTEPEDELRAGRGPS